MSPVIGLLFQSTLSVRRATRLADIDKAYDVFQSTLSVRRATYDMVEFGLVETISIHALRKESDLMLRLGAECGLNFNPRSP